MSGIGCVHWATYKDSEVSVDLNTPQSNCGGGTALGFSTPIATAIVASTLTSIVAKTAAVDGAVEDVRFRPSWVYRDEGDG